MKNENNTDARFLFRGGRKKLRWGSYLRRTAICENSRKEEKNLSIALHIETRPLLGWVKGASIQIGAQETTLLYADKSEPSYSDSNRAFKVSERFKRWF